MTSNELNVSNKNLSNTIYVTSNNAQYYEKLSEQYAASAQKSVTDCATYVSVAQKCVADCENIKSALNAEVINAVDNHVEDKENPHEVTAEQIDVYTKEQVYTKSEVDALETSIVNALHSTMSNSNTAISRADEVAEELNSLESEVANVRSMCESQSGEISSLNSQIQSVDSMLSITESTADDARRKVEMLEPLINSNTAMINDVSTLADTTSGDVQSLSSSVQTLSFDVQSALAHTQQTSGNPHCVTASDIDVYTKSEVDTMISNVGGSDDVDLSGYYTKSEIDTLLENNTTTSTSSGEYIEYVTQDSSWARIHYADSTKSEIKWLEQGGVCTSDVILNSFGGSVDISIPLLQSYNNDSFIRQVSTNTMYSSVKVKSYNESFNNNELQVTIYNTYSMQENVPVYVWWYTAGIPTSNDSNFDDGSYNPR